MIVIIMSYTLELISITCADDNPINTSVCVASLTGTNTGIGSWIMRTDSIGITTTIVCLAAV